MVGFKTFWIILSTLILFVACVPQTKQTECGTNEAFNASLRTCVPVVGGPSSFINISSYSPVFSQSRTRGDTTELEFRISVSNPYNQTYTIEWERVFNAAPVSISTCSTQVYCRLRASHLGTQIGTHIITAKIKDTTGTIVDNHSFELKIDDLPRPVISTVTLTPNTYALEKFPSDSAVPFSFTVNNNGATLSASSNYKTEWTVLKNGAAYYSETDTHITLTTTGTNTVYLGTSLVPYFTPTTLGIGSYIIRAAVYAFGEVVAEQQWNVMIKHPDLANITTISIPSPGVTITAHHNIDYNDYPTYSWIDPTITSTNTAVTPQRFCVTVDDRDGTYSSDGQSIEVRWYLDSLGGEICSKKTLDTSGTQTICLVDSDNCLGTSAPFNVELLKFANSSSVSTEVHKVTARVFDQATSYEFDRADVVPSSGSYPIEWKVQVKPVNSAPVFAFGTTNPTGCTSSGAFGRTGCQVSQGTNFQVSFSVTDDFYTGASNSDKFQWSVNLKHNTADLTTPDVAVPTSCTKAFGATLAYSSGTQWNCTLQIPHYTSTGPLDPSSGTFQVVLTAQDQDSPVGGTGQVAQSLTWTLTVTETNPAGAAGTPLQAQGNTNLVSHIANNSNVVLDPGNAASFATELDTILFRLNVTDAELDNFKYRISLCTDRTSSCSTSVVLTSPAYIDFVRSLQTTPTTNPVLVTGLSYQLPEDLLIARHVTSVDADTVTNYSVYFKVDVIDVPSVGTTTTRSNSEIFSLNVRNYNPAPTINTATAIPAVGSTTVVYSGFPFTIDPGSVTDASVPASERNIQYKWYAKIGAGAWTEISGATSRILRYTPGNISSNIDLKLCVGDGTLANPVSSSGSCSSSWIVTPKPYLSDLAATGSGQLQNEMAVWYDDTNTVANTHVIYSAYVDENEDIFVEKTVKNTSGTVLSTSTISFDAISGDTGGIVSNLSITGTANSLYVAYIASPSTAPGTMLPRLRRIDKSFNPAVGSRNKSALTHPAPFGFNYSHYTLTRTNTTDVEVATSDGEGAFATIEFKDTQVAGDSITINGVVFTAGPASPGGATDLCDETVCAGVNSAATNLTEKINASPNPLLQGITAIASGAFVQLYGQYNADSIDFPEVVAANGLGRIFISGSRWHLPFINASLAGTQQNNVTVLSGPVDFHLNHDDHVVNSSDVLTEMGKTALFDAKLNSSGELVFARISGELSDAGSLALFRYTLSGADWDITSVAGGLATDRNEQDIFGTYLFESVRLATNNTSNNYYYVIAKEKAIAGGEFHIGRYNYQLDSTAASLEYMMTNKVDSATGVVMTNNIVNPDIVSVPGFPEARIFFHSNGSGTYYPYVTRWKSDDSLSCGSCKSLTGTLLHQSTARIGLSQVVNDITLGTAGATASENINDLVFALFSSQIAGNYKPQLGVINVEAEAIQSTSVDGTGLFRPPFVLD